MLKKQSKRVIIYQGNTEKRLPESVMQVLSRKKLMILQEIIKMRKKEKDIFDRIMEIGFLKKLQPFYQKNKEMLLYLFFGVLTTAVSFVTAGLSKALIEQLGFGKGVVSSASTVVSWICAVTFAYVTNRIWVFESSAEGRKEIVSEAASFYGGRLFTLLVEMLMMWAGYSLLGFNYWVTKIIANIVVLILNYVISKLVVFRKKD